MKPTTKMIKTIQKASKTEEFKKKHIIREKDFSRDRKMTFTDIIMFVLSNLRTILPTEIYNFCKQTGKTEFSAAALTKARMKISYTAFKELLEECNSCIPKEKNYHGYELLAVDGMKGELPKTSEFMQSRGQDKRNQYPVFHCVATYDVLNNYYLNGIFNIGNANERELARKSLDETMNEKKQIYVYDRGFPEISLIQKLNDNNKKFVMRVSKSFLKETNEFTNSKLVDKTVHISYAKRRGQTNEVKNANLPYEFDLRMVRIKLNSSTEEILITNLSREELSKRYIKEIYGMRWGIESSFNALKNSVVVEEFMSKKENTILQEFYSSLILYNLTMCFVYDTSFQKELKKKEKN